MTSTARDIRYGRRGGGWAEPPVELPDDLPAQRGGPVDLTRLHHPETIARDPAHLDELWAGRARMAAARQAAGVPLTALDRQALTRQENTP